VVDWGWVSIERKKGVYSKGWRVEVGNYSALSQYSNNKIWETIEDSGVGH